MELYSIADCHCCAQQVELKGLTKSEQVCYLFVTMLDYIVCLEMISPRIFIQSIQLYVFIHTSRTARHLIVLVCATTVTVVL